MGVLMWDKPEKIMSTEEWMAISADCAPPGVYVPNMSKGDAERWKAKLVGTRSGHPRVEIRKTAHGVQVLLIVAAVLDPRPGPNPRTGRVDWTAMSEWERNQRPANIKVSMNGTAFLSFEDLADMNAAIEEARQVLLALDNKD